MKKSLFLILLLSLVLKLFISRITWIDGDEGNPLYNAALMQEGLLPFKDYVARDPFLLFLLYVFINIFGKTLFAGRLLCILLTTAAGYFLYRITKDMYGEKAAIVSSALFLLSPYALFWSTTIKTGVVAAFFTTLSCFFFIKGGSKKYFLSGIFLGLSILTRRVAVLFLPAALICLLLRREKRIFLNAFLLILGVLLPICAVIGYFSYITSPSFMFSTWWGKGKMHEASVAGVPGIKEAIENITSRLILGKKAYSAYLFQKEALYLSAPLVLFLLLYIKRFFKRASYLFFPFSFGSILLFLILSIKWALTISDLHFTLFPLFLFLFALLYLWVLYAIFKESVEVNWKVHLLSLWLFFTAFGYLCFVKINLEYYFDFLPPACILSSSLLLRRKTLFYLLLLLSLFVNASFYIQTGGRYRYWSQQEVKEVATWVSEHTKKDERIFTGATIIPFLSGRRLLFDIAHPIVFHGDGVREYVPLHPAGYPSVPQIIEGLKNVRYVLNCNRTHECFFKMHPSLKAYIEKNYKVVNKIGNVSIMERCF